MNSARFQRRGFLKAAGVCIALPSLESFAAPTNNAAPMRMVCISSALGMNPEAFFPKSFERNYVLSPTLKSLAPLREDFTVFSHMDHPGIYTKHGAMNSLLSGVDAKKAGTGENISIDQVAAHTSVIRLVFRPSIFRWAEARACRGRARGSRCVKSPIRWTCSASCL